MNNSKLLELLNSGTELKSKDLNFLLKHLYQHPDKDVLEDGTLIEFISMMKVAQTREICRINEQISKGIHQLVEMGQWVNISQIIRSLPVELVNAATNDTFPNRSIVVYAQQVAQFMDMSEQDRKICLEASDHKNKEV